MMSSTLPAPDDLPGALASVPLTIVAQLCRRSWVRRSHARAEQADPGPAPGWPSDAGCGSSGAAFGSGEEQATAAAGSVDRIGTQRPRLRDPTLLVVLRALLDELAVHTRTERAGDVDDAVAEIEVPHPSPAARERARMSEIVTYGLSVKE